MSNIVSIQNIAQHVGEEVTIQGWLYARTDKGKLQFLQVRDGTGIMQAVLFRGNVSDEIFEAGKRLTQKVIADCARHGQRKSARARCAGRL